jgi:malate dehydrogenase (oxaloacetate-decarboxylating)(NADP+)
VTEADLALGRIYPDLNRIRQVSAAIAVAVAEVVFTRGLTRLSRPSDLASHIDATVYQPQYRNYV